MALFQISFISVLPFSWSIWFLLAVGGGSCRCGLLPRPVGRRWRRVGAVLAVVVAVEENKREVDVAVGWGWGGPRLCSSQPAQGRTQGSEGLPSGGLRGEGMGERNGCSGLVSKRGGSGEDGGTAEGWRREEKGGMAVFGLRFEGIWRWSAAGAGFGLAARGRWRGDGGSWAGESCVQLEEGRGPALEREDRYRGQARRKMKIPGEGGGGSPWKKMCSP